MSPYHVSLEGQGGYILRTLPLWGEAKTAKCFYNDVWVFRPRTSRGRRLDHLAIVVYDNDEAPKVVITLGVRTTPQALTVVMRLLGTKGQAFGAMTILPFAIKDEIKVPKADCRFRDLIGVVAGHPKHGEFAENA